MDHSARAYPVYSRIRGYRGFVQMLQSLRHFDKSEIAVQRMKIIKFYEKHGEEATREAFGTDRKLISKWKKRLKESGGRLEALVPLSTRPLRTRKSRTLRRSSSTSETSEKHTPVWGRRRSSLSWMGTAGKRDGRQSRNLPLAMSSRNTISSSRNQGGSTMIREAGLPGSTEERSDSRFATLPEESTSAISSLIQWNG